jgi:glycosyltransferase involved in cell wall biosynthesis
MSDKDAQNQRLAAHNPKVSCIIIFLNGETFIQEAIESIIDQTFADWELILVDDGSTDGATAIAQHYTEKFSGKIRYTEHPGHENRGMSASRNAGIALARGDYIAFLDADDIWLPDRLAVHVRAMEKHPDVAMVMGPTVLWSSWKNASKSSRWSWLAGDMTTELGLPVYQPLEPPIVAIGFLECGGGNVPGICSLLIRRDAVLSVGGFVDEFRTLYEDQAFYFKVCLHHKVMAIDEVLDRYRQHEDSACQQAGRMQGDARMRPVFLNWLQDYLIDNGIKSRRLWKAFRKEIWRFDHPKLWRVISVPRRLIDAFNILTRRLVIFILTPKYYNALRRKFRLSVVNVENVG